MCARLINTSIIGGNFIEQNHNVLFAYGALASMDVLGTDYVQLYRLFS